MIPKTKTFHRRVFGSVLRSSARSFSRGEFAYSHIKGARVTFRLMSGQNARLSAVASGVQSSLDSPVQDQNVYDEAIFISGWVFSANDDSAHCRVRAYLDGCCVAETGLLSYRHDV